MLEMARIAKRSGPLEKRRATRLAGGGISISVCAPMARFSLRLGGDLSEEPVGGFVLDQPINQYRAHGKRWSVRLGPDEWLIGAPVDQLESVESEVERALGNMPHSLVEISHRNVGMEISGKDAAIALNTGCPLDLSDTAFPAGAATRTLLGKAEIVLIRPGPHSTYRVETWRSFATYVHTMLYESVLGLG